MIRNVLVSISVFSFVSSASFAQTNDPKTERQYNLSEGRSEEIPAKKATLPFYVYGDESGNLSSFIASGYMGDTKDLSVLTMTRDASAPASTGRTGKTSLKIEYAGKGRDGWAGIYWLAPANNWGRQKGAGFNLSKADRLTFWIRGEKGGERIAQIKIGGINGPYPDTDSAALGSLVLTKNWKKYTIPLEGKDLRHIVGGFMFVIRRADNVRGATFYMDEIVFRTGDTTSSADITPENVTEIVGGAVEPEPTENTELTMVTPAAATVNSVPVVQSKPVAQVTKKPSVKSKPAAVPKSPVPAPKVVHAPARGRAATPDPLTTLVRTAPFLRGSILQVLCLQTIKSVRSAFSSEVS